MTPLQKGENLSDLVDLMNRLLEPAPDGCPWDREQTLETLRPFLIEEAHEVLEAIDENDPPHHAEELGDLLFQIVFQAALREREGSFGIDDVVRSIVTKMKRRHPHVFADASVKDSTEVLANWDKLKSAERKDKGETRRTLDGVPVQLPSLLRAQRVGEKAAKVGFDWPDIAGVRDKVTEELRELDEAIRGGDPKEIEHEVGDVLFALSRLSTKLGVPPEDALRKTIQRFTKRFEHVEDAARSTGDDLAALGLERLEALWQRAKADERGVPKK